MARLDKDAYRQIQQKLENEQRWQIQLGYLNETSRIHMNRCLRCDKGTPTSIHGRCLDCGATKFPSEALANRVKRANTYATSV